MDACAWHVHAHNTDMGTHIIQAAQWLAQLCSVAFATCLFFTFTINDVTTTKKKDNLTMCMQNTTNFYNIMSALALCFLFLLVLCDRAAPAAVVVQECRFALLFHKAT